MLIREISGRELNTLAAIDTELLDITDEPERQRGAVLFRTIVEHNVDGVIIVDENGIVRFSNPAAQVLFGLSAEEFEGRLFGFPIAVDDDTEIDILRGDEEPAVVEMRVTEVEWHGERMYLASLRDITERKRAEEELQQYRDHLEELVEEHTRELGRSNAELQRFAYVAAHHMQEPLRLMAIYTQLLARRYSGKLDADADEFISYIVGEATHMKDLINDLLAYSQLDKANGELELVDFNAMLKRALAILQLEIMNNNATVTYDSLPALMADDAQILQLLIHLIGNAVKFHNAEIAPCVHISAELRDGEWLFSVRDNGIGIEAEYIDRIFAIFQRLHTREEYAGTGVGLSVCKKIVERYGGEIWVESQSGQGSTFYFTLPALEE